MEKVFEEHPALKECWKTSDGQYFYNENAASNHAKKLKDKSVEHLENPGSSEEDDEPTLETELAKVKKLRKELLIAYAVENQIDLGSADTVKEILAIVVPAIEEKFTNNEE